MNIPAVPRRVSLLLQNVGKRFGFDAEFFAKNSFIATFTYISSLFSGLVTGYLVARMLPAESYGEYKFVLGICGIVGIISLSGLGSAISRDIARKAKDEVALRFTMKQNALLCLAGSVILLGCIALLPLWHKESLWPMFVIAALVFVPNQVGSTFFSGIVTGTAAFWRSLKVTAMSSVLMIVTVLPMLFFFPSPTLLLALVVGIPAMLYLLEVRHDLPLYPSEEKSWSIMRYGTQLSINTVPLVLSDYLDGILVSSFFGLKTLAIFSVAIIIPDQVKAWTKSLLPVSFARQAAGNDNPERRRKMMYAVAIGTLLFAIGILAYMIVSPWILYWLFPRYRDQLPELVLLSRLSALILIATPASLFPQFLEARGMVRELRQTQWVSSIVFCIALLALVPPMGAVGALIARGIFRVTYVGWAFLCMRKIPTSLKTA